jgi:hypothetical protein
MGIIVKRLRNKTFKNILLSVTVVFMVFVFSPSVLAVTYNSGLYNAGYYSDTVPATAVAVPSAGTYNATQSVSLSATGSTSIRYSIVSTPVNCSSGTLYSTPISVSTSQTIYVIACNAYNNYSVASFAYIIDTVPPSTPVASPVAGAYNATQSVTLSATGSDYIKYATDSLPVSCSVGTTYTGSISVSTSETVYVRACDNAGNSSTASFAYIIDTSTPLTPVASPVSGTYNTTQTVSLTSTGSSSIRYSIVSTPTDCSSGTLYSTPISVSTSQTIYTRACTLANNSSTASFSYIIDTVPPDAPIASPVAGTYNTAQSVSLSAVGSTYIKYSISSLPASCSAGTSYTGAISIPSSQTIYVRACDDAGNSSTSSFAYVISAEQHFYGGSLALPITQATKETQKATNTTNTIDTSVTLTIPTLNTPIISNTSNAQETTTISDIQKVTKNLKLGTVNKDVKTLQLFLIKQDKGKAAKALAKSKITNNFGKLTKAALIEWQKANKIIPADGIFGIKTRVKIKDLINF